MGLLVTAEVVVGVCLAAVLVWLASVFVRRRMLERGSDLLLCAARPPPQVRWQAGLLRFGDASLTWYPVLGVTLRPAYGWERRSIELGPLQDNQPGGDAVDPAMVRMMLEGRSPVGERLRVELCLRRDAYTALRAWVEAGPPGRRPVDW